MASRDSFDKRWVKAADFRTICEVLREIYWATEDPEIRKKSKEATAMAKKMDKRLRHYRDKYEEEYEVNSNAKEITEHRRALRKKQEDKENK